MVYPLVAATGVAISTGEWTLLALISGAAFGLVVALLVELGLWAFKRDH